MSENQDLLDRASAGDYDAIGTLLHEWHAGWYSDYLTAENEGLHDPTASGDLTDMKTLANAFLKES